VREHYSGKASNPFKAPRLPLPSVRAASRASTFQRYQLSTQKTAPSNPLSRWLANVYALLFNLFTEEETPYPVGIGKFLLPETTTVLKSGLTPSLSQGFNTPFANRYQQFQAFQSFNGNQGIM
jgi:hypothetical protein